MKVLYFHEYFNTKLGSGGLRSYEFARMLLERGHQVTVACGRSNKSITGLEHLPFRGGQRRGIVDGIELVEFDLPYSNADGFLKRTFTFVKYSIRGIPLTVSEDYDLVFATSTPLTVAIPGMFARWFRRKPFVFEVRDLWPELPRAMGVITNPIVLSLISMLEWMSYHSANRLIGLSPGIMEGIARRGISRDAITLIPNGCDLEIFDAPAEMWRPVGVAASDLMAVFAGTHGIANGLGAVLDTAAALKARGRSDIKLVLIGEGRVKPELEARAHRERLDNVIFHDSVNKARLAGLMASTDIGLQVLANIPAFYYGTSPNKFFDYIASGLPVLINYPGWLAGMITESQCGYAVPPDDAEAMADVLIRAADNRTELEGMGARGRELARRQFDRRMLAGQFVDWLEGTAAR